MTTQEVTEKIEEAKYQSEAIQACATAYYLDMWGDPPGQFDLTRIGNALIDRFGRTTARKIEKQAKTIANS